MLEGKDLQRFISKIDSTGECWLWKGGSRGHGYGAMNINGKTTPAHRISYELFKGSIPEGLVIDHLCRIHQCVNPKHLEAVTQGENIRRGKVVAPIVKICCDAGHEYSEENTIYNPTTGKRRCRECNNRWHRESYRNSEYYRGGIPAKDRTHCPQGHPYVGSNLSIKGSGYRVCKECHRKHSRASHHKSKVAKCSV